VEQAVFFAAFAKIQVGAMESNKMVFQALQFLFIDTSGIFSERPSMN
jgi:hypothetical protein